MAVFEDDRLGEVRILALLVIIPVAVEREHDVRVLLDGAGLTEVGQHRALILARLVGTRQLRQADDRNIELLGHDLEHAAHVGDGLRAALIRPAVAAAGRLHELQIVDDDKAKIRDAAALGFHGSKERITEREYWAAKKGQLALDKENAAREAAGQPTKPTKFETDKAKLRRTIRQALSQATSFDEFSSLLLREGVTVKESRGRLSYLTPDRTKPITARKLGDDFDKAAVLALLTQNAHRAAEKPKAIPEYPHTQKGRLQEEKTAKTAPADNTLQRMVDREAKRAEGKGVGYDRWASLHNLKQMAATHNFLMENELLDLDKLDAAVESSRKALSEARESLRGIEQSISDKKSLRKVVNDYRRTRPTIDAHKKLSGRKAENYRQSHEAEFIIYEAALRQLKVLAPGKKLPATSKLNTEIEALISEKNAAYNTYRTAKAEYEQLATAKRNAEQILHGTPSRQKKHEQER